MPFAYHINKTLEIRYCQVLARMWENRNLHILLQGLQNGAYFLKSKYVSIPKLKPNNGTLDTQGNTCKYGH